MALQGARPSSPWTLGRKASPVDRLSSPWTPGRRALGRGRAQWPRRTSGSADARGCSASWARAGVAVGTDRDGQVHWWPGKNGPEGTAEVVEGALRSQEQPEDVFVDFPAGDVLDLVEQAAYRLASAARNSPVRAEPELEVDGDFRRSVIRRIRSSDCPMSGFDVVDDVASV